MNYDVFVLKKNGCVYDFVFVGDPAKSEAGLETFESFVGTFHTLSDAETTSRLALPHTDLAS